MLTATALLEYDPATTFSKTGRCTKGMRRARLEAMDYIYKIKLDQGTRRKNSLLSRRSTSSRRLRSQSTVATVNEFDNLGSYSVQWSRTTAAILKKVTLGESTRRLNLHSATASGKPGRWAGITAQRIARAAGVEMRDNPLNGHEEAVRRHPSYDASRPSYSEQSDPVTDPAAGPAAPLEVESEMTIRAATDGGRSKSVAWI